MAKEQLLGKIPPQNIEAEAAVLGAVLTSKDAMDKIADIITDVDFYRTDHQTIYRAVLRLYDKRAPIDLVTLTNELEGVKQLDGVGGAAYLAELVNSVPTAIHVAHYAEIVHQKAVLRRILTAGQKISQLGYEEDREVAEVLDQAEKAIFEVSHAQVKDNFMPISDILASSFDRIDQLHREKGILRGVTTGFRDLDHKLSGFQNSDLIILAARPSMGKTALALNMALNAAVKGKTPVGFFSLEQSKEQLVDRLICAQAMVDGWKLRTGNLSEDDFPAIGMAMGTLAEAPIFIDDSPMLTTLDIRTRARRLKADHNLGLIVVDYLQLISGGMSGGYGDNNRVQEVSEISRNLKALARELDVPVLALAQLSRAVESRDKKTPQLSDLRDSGSIEQDADVVMFIYREDYYERDTERKGMTDILIRKHRNGPIGEVELHFRAEQARFFDVERKQKVATK
ncbi:MAG TPA: replicative DNA helicase [Candidatus Saccharimonadales bacterium]|nr:replicative DNA helicase [Candidatus Saccharimonadales bacterium]